MASAKIEKSKLGVHLDVGHDSIGWCVTRTCPGNEKFLAIPGTGVVIFPADDCLANKRRDFRRQRRHIRATRQRIARMKSLLLDKGVLTESELNVNLTAAPWKLAAQVLRGGNSLSWQELWCVLRWYAHNRGYDGNRLASAKNRSDVDNEDIKKNQASRDLMKKYGTESMAETMCKYMKVEPDGNVISSMTRFKGLGVSFDRSVVVKEVMTILERHIGILKGVDKSFINLLMMDPLAEPHNYLFQQPNLPFRIQNRYWGGVLFGQLSPRFDNRIIGHCPISGKKLPSKTAKEFLAFRWSMVLANIRVGLDNRALSVPELNKLDKLMNERGGFTKGDFKKAVAEATSEKMTNVDALMTSPDADKSLIKLPGLYSLTRVGLDKVLQPSEVRKYANMLFKGKRITIAKIAETLDEKSKKALTDSSNQPKRGKKKSASDFLGQELKAELQNGRAPYSREVMANAVKEVFSGKHPMEKGGSLYRNAVEEDALLEKKIDCETNNHLIRHRVKILLRLMKDIIHDYADNNPAQVGQITIEVARDLKDLSGMTQKQIVTDMLDRTRQHTNAAKMIAKHLGVDERMISPGLIRKVRIAEDMNWTCPYTGQKFDIQDIVSKGDGESGVVDKDHILPRSQRAADSLDSLVMTFTEVNRMKGARTGLQFVRECGGQRVLGRDNLVILDEAKYKSLVDDLKVFGHNDDRSRQKRRKQNLLRLKSDEAGMTDGMLTRTSHITKLASKALRGLFVNCGRMPEIVTIPGRVTANLRMQWNLLGVLAEIDNRVKDENGNLRLKQEIRGITHMHHAVDAITLGLAATLLPRDGTFWAMMCKRRVTEIEKSELLQTGVFVFSSQNEPRLIELPKFLQEEIATALSEQRVVVHQPQEKSGLKVLQNIWGVEGCENGIVNVRQRSRDEKTGKITIKREKIPMQKAFGLQPKKGVGKLYSLKGVLLPDVNYGVAVTDKPAFVRHQNVWNELGNLKQQNGGKMPMIIRRGGLIEVADGSFSGVWRVASVKDNTSGIALDIVRPYAVKVQNKVDFAKINVRLESLIKAGVKVLEVSYTGVSSCLTTSSTSRPMA